MLAATSASRPRASETVRSGRVASCANSRAASARSQQHGFGHAIEQRRGQLRAVRRADSGSSARKRPHDAALDAAHGVQPAHLRDVGGLARPGRDRAEARHDDDFGARPASRCTRGFARSIGQQALEQRAFARIEVALEIDEMDVARADGAQAGLQLFEGRAQFGDAEIGDCGGAWELDHWRARIVMGLASHFRAADSDGIKRAIS